MVAEGEPAQLKRELDVTSLDDVYLHYAGRRYSDATRLTEVAGAMTTVTYREATRPAPAPGAGLISDTWYLTGAQAPRAGPPAVRCSAMGVIQPVIWLFLFGELFHKVIDIPGFGYQGSYLAYLIPGIVAMNAMSGNMWAGMATIEEIDRGTLNRFLVTPASRLAIMNASVAEQAVSTVVQTLIIVLLGLRGRCAATRAARLASPS